MEVPGQVGWTVTGDKTVEFARYPLDFVKNRIEKYNSKVFLSRALNKPTVFVASSSGVADILQNKESSFRMGYKDFGYMHALYGDLFLFEDDEEACKVRELTKRLFHPDECIFYLKTITELTDEKLSSLYLKPSVDTYEVFKDLATHICLALFLDIDTKEDYETIKAITTTHWHGLLSVPLNFKVKGWTSSYGKAAEAKEYLLKVILDKLNNGNDTGRFFQCVLESGFSTKEEAASHVLLFISAIIPKAFSSLLTSFVLETAGEIKKDLREKCLANETFLDDVMLEIQRLWPPLYGGRRFTTKSVEIDGYRIPADHCVAYITKFANRDESVFHHADEFRPERWQNEDAEKREVVWTFGAGSRSCIGIHFINRMLCCISTYLLSNYNWSIVDIDSAPIYKTLPVARPKDAVLVSFTKRDPSKWC